MAFLNYNRENLKAHAKEHLTKAGITGPVFIAPEDMFELMADFAMALIKPYKYDPSRRRQAFKEVSNANGVEKPKRRKSKKYSPRRRPFGDDGTNYLNAEELANLLQVPNSTLYSWEKAMGLPFVKEGRGHYYSKEAVSRWLYVNAAEVRERKRHKQRLNRETKERLARLRSERNSFLKEHGTVPSSFDLARPTFNGATLSV